MGKKLGFQRGEGQTLWPLVIMRLVIGWHIFIEGLGKLMAEDWTAYAYLAYARGPLAGLFHWMADTPAVLATIDVVNVWAQIILGLALMLGLLTQLACLGAAVILILYYLAQPPAGIFNTLLVEVVALIVLLLVPTGQAAGLDGLLRRRRHADQAVDTDVSDRDPGEPLADRRDLIRGLAGVPFVAAMGTVTTAKNLWLSKEEKDLADAFTGASRKAFDFPSLQELDKKCPVAKIGNKEISRIILGGNIICGFAHSRDLIYVSSLVRAYHTPTKIFESLRLAEECGINTILTHPSIATAIQTYWKELGGKIQFLADCGWMDGTDTLGAIDYAIDHGATLCYLQGECADSLVRENKWDYMDQCLERVRSQGLPMGIGAHRIETLQAIAEKGIKPDFWMKTFHPHAQSYWSGRHPEEHDNKYCYDPEATIEFMNSRKEPWIAFKTMAAGSVRPEQAFQYAFESGADFICAGMYDFQMVQDINITTGILDSNSLNRHRAWMA